MVDQLRNSLVLGLGESVEELNKVANYLKLLGDYVKQKGSPLNLYRVLGLDNLRKLEQHLNHPSTNARAGIDACLDQLKKCFKQIVDQEDSSLPLFTPDIIEACRKQGEVDVNNIPTDYKVAKDILKVSSNEAVISNDDVKELETMTPYGRLIFYLCLRTTLRNIAGFERESRDWSSAFNKEVQILGEQFSHLIKLKERATAKKRVSGRSKNIHIAVFQSRYSLSCGLSFDAIKKALDSNPIRRMGISDAQKRFVEFPRDEFDVIVTDPPYGFNTDDGTEALSKVWDAALRGMFKALRRGGQLILCLPDRSHTGRGLQWFTQKDFIAQQILAIADDMQVEAIVHADIVPFPTKLFRPPFYWESERALRRQILHFRFRPRENTSTPSF